MRRRRVSIAENDLVELDVRLFFPSTQIRFHDLDNRLKDIMDALQGHLQGSGKKRRGAAVLLPNDSQVMRVVIEKGLPPKQSRGLGHVMIRRYKPAKLAKARRRSRTS